MYDIDKIVNDNPLKEFISQYTDLKPEGNEFRGLCPLHQEKSPSFTVVPHKGYYHCHGCNAHGSVIDFVREKHGLTFNEACKHFDVKEMPKGEKPKKVIKREVVNEADEYKALGGEIDFGDNKITKPLWSFKNKRYGTLDAENFYTYCNPDGSVVGYVVRIMASGKKMTIPVQMVERNDKQFPCMIAFKLPRPVYKIEKLNPEGPIYIVEGEKAADALEEILGKGHVISWSMGTNATKQTNWDLLPEGREYILIPDADRKVYREGHEKAGELLPKFEQGGYKAMVALKKLLPKPSNVSIVDTDCMGDLKDGWDVADKEFTKEEFTSWLDGLIKPEVEVVIKKKEEKNEYKDEFFKCLGFSGKHYFFYHKPTGQVWSFMAREMSKTTLVMLAPLDWWCMNFPKKNGVDWDDVLDYYLRVQEKVGIFDVNCIRGRGAWIDKGRAVLHMGTNIIVDGEEMSTDEIESEFLYMKGSSLALDYGAFLPAEESNKLVEACTLIRWAKPSSGELLAGWMFSSLVCGVMPFRSHAYLTGESGSGKSWVMDNIVSTVMGRMALLCGSTTSESGIRKALENDVRPVIFNEAEAEDAEGRKRMQGVNCLARAASDEHAAPILKGSGDGESFICRSSFMFASINRSTERSADVNRTVFLEIKGSPKSASTMEKETDNANFKKLEAMCDELLTDEYIGSLLTRAVNLISVMRKNHQIFADTGAKVTGSRRVGSTLAMPLCGLYGLMSDDVVPEDKAIELIKKFTDETEKSDVDETQEVECLDKLLFTEISVEDDSNYRRTIQVAEVISILSHKRKSDGWDKKALSRSMGARGLMIKEDFLWLASKPDALPSTCYKDSKFCSGWKDALKRLDGVEVFKTTYFSGTLRAAGVKIPLSSVVTVEKDLFGKE